ncbi:UspA domain-containing protein [mine drainage metagenome]|uniref:UspA domain-containing protein n=1 Tax=mine drainage metagenome TaxID=410659 RepID=T1D0G6_9ZZZZ
MYETILLAYDGTRESRLALREGAEIAERFGARTHLLAVINLPTALLGGEALAAGGGMAREIERCQEVLNEGLERLKARGLECVGHLERGDPSETIERLAREVHADLIVLGYHRRSGLGKWWHTPTCTLLIDHTPTSLLVAIRDEPPETDP